jgi:transposase
MIEALMQEGFTRREIAQRMSLRYESISRYVNRYNLKA